MKYELTNRQAREFLLRKHGLLGDYRYQGMEGIKKFLQDIHCIQYDPVDICGQNADIILFSRVKDYQKPMLRTLLYEKRELIEYWDKNLSIFLVEDWPYFNRIRSGFHNSYTDRKEIKDAIDKISEILETTEFISSKDLDLNKKVDWYWSETKLARAALEAMYYQGKTAIHHRQGNIRYFSLAKKIIKPEIYQSIDPNRTDDEYLSWRILRRISGTGMLWNKNSDALLFIKNCPAQKRNEIFQTLVDSKDILEVSVEGIKTPFYIATQDESFLQEILSEKKFPARTELLAPLDSLLWDRKLIKAIFNFDYTWEIYHPQEKVRFGRYVLPILSDTAFIGRAELIAYKNEDCLHVKHCWYEKDAKISETVKSLITDCFKRFASLHNLKNVTYETDWEEYL